MQFLTSVSLSFLSYRARNRLAALVPVALLACAHKPAPASESPAAPPAVEATSASVAPTPEAAGPFPTEPAVSASAAPIAVSGSEVTYSAGKTELKGYLAAPQGAGPAPGILVVHEWWGQNEYAQRRARMLAELGYVALAVDMYGGGKTTNDPKVAGQLSKDAYSNGAALKAKFLAARELLAKDPRVDNSKIGAVGYCFGGGVILNMARQGVDLDVVASFHGTLKADKPLKKGAFKGAVLIETGDADPMVPLKDVDAIRSELTNAAVPFQIDIYPGAKHAFTNPDATELGKQFNLPVAYDAAADAKSWDALTALLQKTWATK